MKNLLIIALFSVSCIVFAQDSENPDKEINATTLGLSAKKIAKMEKTIAQQMRVHPKYIKLLKVKDGKVEKSKDQVDREYELEQEMIKEGSGSFAAAEKISYNKSTYVVFIFNENRLCTGYYTKSKEPYIYSCSAYDKSLIKKDSVSN